MTRLLTALAALLVSIGAGAQSSPNWPNGYKPSAVEWAAEWASKFDYQPGLSAGNVLTWSGTNWYSAAPAAAGTVQSVSVSSANGFSGMVATPTTTPAITLSTSITGPLKGSAGSLASSLAADIYGLWSGSCSSSTYLRGDGSCATPAGAGSVTTVSVASANGFGGTVANASTTPAITLTTSITGPLKGSASALSAAAAADIYGLWSGTCNSSSYLRGDGTCASPAGAGTVTSIATGSGLTGGTITSSGTINLANVSAPSHQWFNSVAGNVLVSTQPSFSDISGTFQAANWPTLTANAFLTGGGAATQPNAVALTGIVVGNGVSAPTAASSTIPSGTSGTGNIVLGTSPTIATPTLTTPTVNGYVECADSPTPSAGTVTISNTTCTYHKVSLTANTTINIPAPAAGVSYTVQTCYGGTYTVTWSIASGTLSWPGATVPAATSANGKCDFYIFTSHDTSYTYGQDGGRNFVGS